MNLILLITKRGKKMKTETQIRKEFSQYFIDLRKSMEADGVKVSKRHEWDNFISQAIEEGEVGANASKWKCPQTPEHYI
jgi:hypothetical protein